jgi:hypothetical protein
MSELSVSIDMLPARCKVMFTFCGPITAAYAENIDTGVTGPLVSILAATKSIQWADLDPDGLVAP